MTAVVGLQPFVGLTFVFFALFPLSLALVPDGYGLILAFVVYGMREIGEPARKALITSLVPKAVRAEGVGLYWGQRSVSVCWASLVGALVWRAFGPDHLLYLAFAFGCAEAAIFHFLARLEGMGALGIWAFIAMPLARPATAAVCLLTFVQYWSDFMNPLLYLKSDDRYTLALGLRVLQQMDAANWPLLMAAAVVMMLPVLLLLFLVQHAFWPAAERGQRDTTPRRLGAV